MFFFHTKRHKNTAFLYKYDIGPRVLKGWWHREMGRDSYMYKQGSGSVTCRTKSYPISPPLDRQSLDHNHRCFLCFTQGCSVAIIWRGTNLYSVKTTIWMEEGDCGESLQKTLNDAAFLNLMMTFYAMTQLKTRDWRLHYRWGTYPQVAFQPKGLLQMHES